MDKSQMNKIEVIAFPEPWNAGIGLLFKGFKEFQNGPGPERFLGVIDFEKQDDKFRTWPDKYKLDLSFDEAQKLINHLWDCGLRPQQGQGTAGQLEAVKYHLEDFRRLVFNQGAEQ